LIDTLASSEPEGVEPGAGFHEDVVLEQTVGAIHPHVDAVIGVDYADAAEHAGVPDPLRTILSNQIVDSRAERVLEANRRVCSRAQQSHGQAGVGRVRLRWLQMLLRGSPTLGVLAGGPVPEAEVPLVGRDGERHARHARERAHFLRCLACVHFEGERQLNGGRRW
jgi:hypothetical protein